MEPIEPRAALGTETLKYIVYKTTNLVNGKYYVGKHQTKNLDDGYVGSGKILKRAIKKYGVKNFVTEILHVFDEERKMNLAERILVVIDSEISYNLCPGGQGGFGFINKSGKNVYDRSTKGPTKESLKKASLVFVDKLKNNLEFRHEYSNKMSIIKKKEFKNKDAYFLGKSHTEETKKIISENSKIHQRGEKNSQYGTCWINNGLFDKKISKDDIDIWLSKGYHKGRIKRKMGS